MKASERDFLRIKRSVLCLVGTNLLSSLVATTILSLIFWASWSDLIPWSTYLGATFNPFIPFVLPYLGILIVTSALWGPVQSLLFLKRLSECNEVNKTRRHSEVWSARLIQTPLLGMTACWLAKREGESIITDTLRMTVAISAHGKEIDLSEIMKNRPTCAIPEAAVEAFLNEKNEPRIFIHEGDTYFIVQNYPKQLLSLLSLYDYAVFGKERAGQW